MGVRMLNKYLCEHCCDAMKQITVGQLRGKKIAIDTSIFLYQFKGNNMLLENMIKMIEQFRAHHITPVYVFDGTPPDEKMELLNKRDITKKIAKQKCDDIEKTLNTSNNLTEEERKELEGILEKEKKNCLRITNANIRDVKRLISVMGVPYIEAEGEADDLCVYLVKNKLVWACMTEDMDMFVYGCQRVLRNYNLKKGTMTLYHMDGILNNLAMNQDNFREVCILSGSDYNRSRFSIFASMGLFYKYLRRKKGNIGFYDWLIYTKTINDEFKETLLNTKNMFLLDSVKQTIKNCELVKKIIIIDDLKKYMDKHQINIY